MLAKLSVSTEITERYIKWYGSQYGCDVRKLTADGAAQEYEFEGPAHLIDRMLLNYTGENKQQAQELYAQAVVYTQTRQTAQART
jgi:hypothetical protein